MDFTLTVLMVHCKQKSCCLFVNVEENMGVNSRSRRGFVSEQFVSAVTGERDYLMTEDVACGWYIPSPQMHAHTFDIFFMYHDEDFPLTCFY